jgi:putative membrane protein insertion efficiency factor
VRGLVVALIRLYQLTFSVLLGRHCRFNPSCSVYMQQAVQRFGVVRGVGLGLRRIARCGPLGGSGYQGAFDPVPEE